MLSNQLTQEEKQTIAYYDAHAQEWSNRRKKETEASFWKEELDVFQSLQPPQGMILELGSGSGREALELTQMGYAYVGVDTSAELLKIAMQRLPSSSFVQATPYHLPFPAQSFDAFFSWAMLPHVPKQRLSAALTSLKAVLKPGAGGFFAMREGIGFSEEPSTGRWFSYYSQEELLSDLFQNGFKVQRYYKKFSRIDLTWLIFFVRLLY